jgi:hypothetical protein
MSDAHDEQRRRLCLGTLGAAALAGTAAPSHRQGPPDMAGTDTPDLILHNGRFTTLDRANPTASAVAIKDGRFTARGPRPKTCCRWPAAPPA